MKAEDWRCLLDWLEAEAGSLDGRAGAQELKPRVEAALAQAEAGSAEAEVLGRLDELLLVLTEASRENVCMNASCPHYNKKCRMR
jgi:hypothetical protein